MPSLCRNPSPEDESTPRPLATAVLAYLSAVSASMVAVAVLVGAGIPLDLLGAVV